MDAYAEYMVKKQPDSRDTAKRIGILALALILTAASILATILTGIPFILIITCAILYGAYYLFTNLSVEYEYAVTNTDLDVDKIIAKRKRVHLVSANIAKCEAFGKFTESIPDDANRTLVLCADNAADSQEYYLDAETEDYGAVRIVFTPNEAVLDVIRTGLPPQIRNRVQE